MELYLIRHGDAAPLGEDGITLDAERPLTGKGEAQARAVAAALQRLGITPGAVVTSPLLRARQTAEGVIRALPSPAPELLVCDELGPGGKRRKLARAIQNATREQVALVGHQPDLGKWAAWLIGSKKARIDLAKGGVAHISCDGAPDKGAGTLIWLVTGDWLGEQRAGNSRS